MRPFLSSARRGPLFLISSFELSRLRTFQHVLDHEEDILSDGLGLLFVLDWVRPTNPSGQKLDSDSCGLDLDSARQPKSEAGWTKEETQDSVAGASISKADREHAARWLQPLFVSCTSTNTNNDSSGALQHALGMADPAMLDVDIFPCALSTHVFGGVPTSVLATAAAASALLESLDLSHFEASRSHRGRSSSGQQVIQDAAADGDIVMRSVAAMEPQRFEFLLPLGPDLQDACADDRDRGWPGEAQRSVHGVTDGSLPWRFLYQSLPQGGQARERALAWVRRDAAQGRLAAVLGVEWELAVLAVGQALWDVQEAVQHVTVTGAEDLAQDHMKRLTIVGYPGRLGNWLFRVAAGLGMVRDTGGSGGSGG